MTSTKRSRGSKTPRKNNDEPKAAKAKRKPARARSDSGRRAGIALREAITTALGQDTELAAELEDARRRAGGKRGAAVLLHAADALEPILAGAVERKPSFLGRLAYGTAQLIGTLATDDAASRQRFTEIAGGDHVGIVFIDVVGFTEFTATNGDEAAVEVVKRLEMLVGSICTLHDGDVVKHLGDGFLLAFATAADAVRAALALRDACRRKRRGAPAFLPVRIAVHAGRPSVVGEDLIGHDVNLTARLLGHCEPGEVLVTAGVKELLEAEADSLQFAGERTLAVRGIATPIVAYRVE